MLKNIFLKTKECEICGKKGLLHMKNYWYKTLCKSCAETGEYVPVKSEKKD
jgi:hypothetical protein